MLHTATSQQRPPPPPCCCPLTAGKAMKDRDAVQEAFLKGRCRVVVATVAFGMGLDKQRLAAVVHLSLPRSLEDYVQQVGLRGVGVGWGAAGPLALAHL
jgi:superfamily II DNA helicase RecQ